MFKILGDLDGGGKIYYFLKVIRNVYFVRKKRKETLKYIDVLCMVFIIYWLYKKCNK